MKGESGSRYRRNKRRNQFILLAIIVVLIVVIVVLIFKLMPPKEPHLSGDNGTSGAEITSGANAPDDNQEKADSQNVNNQDTDNQNEEHSDGDEAANPTKEGAQELLAELMDRADRVAKGYDYDAAIGLLTSVEGYESDAEITERIKEYEEQKAALVEWEDVTKISHVFFHSLIVDTSKAFDGDDMAEKYNTVMTTVDEFNKIMEQMYERGYVLVRIHDMADFVTEADGSVKFTKGKIMLPKGKIPFVLSEDDVNYYEYMKGDGYANRLVIGEDGMVTTEMDMEDGTSVQGPYDVVPLLEAFIKEHPDFSYRGARGILAVTGYEGVFGYRTSRRDNADNPTLEEDTRKATEVADRLKEMGWELASHGWGHRRMGEISYDKFVWDVDIWDAEVKPILGDTDIYIYPFGNDIGNWKPYKGDRYEYLKSKGFVYFCYVDASAPYWGQITDEYLRQGRINFDGMRMYEAISGGKNRLESFFDVKSVFDKARPLPIPGV